MNNQSNQLKPNTNPQTTGGLFSNPNQNVTHFSFPKNIIPNIFDTKKNQNQQTGGLFSGNQQQQQPQQGATGGLFGNNTQQSNQSGTGLFGTNNQQQNQTGGLLNAGNNMQNNQQQSNMNFGFNQQQQNQMNQQQQQQLFMAQNDNPLQQLNLMNQRSFIPKALFPTQNNEQDDKEKSANESSDKKKFDFMYKPAPSHIYELSDLNHFKQKRVNELDQNYQEMFIKIDNDIKKNGKKLEELKKNNEVNTSVMEVKIETALQSNLANLKNLNLAIGSLGRQLVDINHEMDYFKRVTDEFERNLVFFLLNKQKIGQRQNWQSCCLQNPF